MVWKVVTLCMYCVHVCVCKTIFLEGTRRNALTSRATDYDIHNEIKLWLRGATSRNGGRAERARKALEKEQRQLSARSARSHHSSDRDRSRSHSSSPGFSDDKTDTRRRKRRLSSCSSNRSRSRSPSSEFQGWDLSCTSLEHKEFWFPTEQWKE